MITALFLSSAFVNGVSVPVVGSGFSSTRITDTNNDACADSGNDILNALYCDWKAAFRFVNVGVPRGSTIAGASAYFSCPPILGSPANALFIEDAVNSMPFTSLSNVQSRAWIGIGGSAGPSYDARGVGIVVGGSGWMYGNNITLKIEQKSGPFTIFDTPECTMFSYYFARLDINYQVQGNMELQGPFTLVPLSGNWTSGLNVASINSSLSVGILNMKIMNPFNYTTTNLTLTNGFFSNGQYTFDCLNLQLSGSGDKRNVTCDLSCAPGTGYKLTVNLCLSLQTSSFPISWSPNPYCFNVTANGTINFPDPILMPGTLRPDTRPYAVGAGLLNATATVQVISNRDNFLATMGVQYLCTTSLSQWATFQFGNFQITIVQVLDGVHPPLASEGYTTLSLLVPRCLESACPGLVPMNVTMRYMNATTMTTKDRLVYPTNPVIAAVAGCEDISATTINCPSSGGIWINITMSQSSGYIGVIDEFVVL